MKFNWGWAIVLAFVVFIASILVAVFVASDNPEEMVTTDYYEKGVHKQEEIDQIKNYTDLQGKITTQKDEDFFRISFPSDFDGKTIVGDIHFYRPSKEILDFFVDFELDDSTNTVEVPYDKLHIGQWKLIIQWECEGVKYHHKQPIRI